jgi:ADP-ribosyl-[dinitrogen reductase] hydrolase
MELSESQEGFADRIRGSFVGLAVVDALGAPVEFRKRGTFSQVTEMLPNKNFGLPKGHFTDDTSMALCLAHTLLESGPYKPSPSAQARAYLRWWHAGWMSSADYCFDIGVSTRLVLMLWESRLRTHDRDAQSPEQQDPDAEAERERATLGEIREKYSEDRFCGNGSLMRVLPVALLLTSSEETTHDQLHQCAEQTSVVTHPHPVNSLACGLYVTLVADALKQRTKDQLCSKIVAFLNDIDQSRDNTNPVRDPLSARLLPYTCVGDFLRKETAQISSSGYVVDTLEAALWSFFTTDTFEAGAIKVVNLGDDADTVGAVYAGLAGAFYGYQAIPQRWISDMQRLDLVNEVVDKIIQIATQGGPQSWTQKPNPRVSAN